MCGCGSDELINLIAHAYVGPGDEAVYTEHGFLMYKIATLSSGGKPVPVPEKDYRADVDAHPGARRRPRPRSSSSPTPTTRPAPTSPHDEVRRLHKGLPSDTLLVLDAAYCEYVRRNDYEAGLELVATTDNTVMTRTFSKIYGLAALRLGWAYCPAAVADVLNRVRGPFNVTAPAHRGRRGGARRPGARRDRRRAQRQVAAVGDGRDREAGPRGHAERRQLRADPLPGATRARTRPPPTSS